MSRLKSWVQSSKYSQKAGEYDQEMQSQTTDQPMAP